MTAVSAPGKVLLAGGYLVLDRDYTGLVLGLSARIHVHVRDLQLEQDHKECSDIIVNSPQFRDASWTYSFRVAADEGGVAVVQQPGTSASSSKNPFVETALAYALTYISSVLPTPINPTSITILADHDYYSQPSNTTTTSNSNGSSHSFTDFGVRLQDAHKTGLGSSAALVTAFTGALLTHYLPPSQFSLSTPTGRAQLHNLAQAAHCAAQGKVGSGFDVAAAVYGSCVYRRFSPSLLSSLGESGSAGFATRVRAIVDDDGESWDTEVLKEGVSIPEGYALVMCDVDCGSQTVGMVKEVLAWRAREPNSSKSLWDQLQASNEVLGTTLAEGPVGDLGTAFDNVREKIREMGRRSGVPIEPQEQTELLDALTEGVSGVVGGVVPGAGGYDAVALLVKDEKETIDEIKAFLVKWSSEKKGNVKLLGAKGEIAGARPESAAIYSGF